MGRGRRSLGRSDVAAQFWRGRRRSQAGPGRGRRSDHGANLGEILLQRLLPPRRWRERLDVVARTLRAAGHDAPAAPPRPAPIDATTPIGQAQIVGSRVAMSYACLAIEEPMQAGLPGLDDVRRTVGFDRAAARLRSAIDQTAHERGAVAAWAEVGPCSLLGPDAMPHP